MEKSTEEKKIIITVEQALSLLNKKRYVHSFRQAQNGTLLGADYEMDELVKDLTKNKKTLQLSGSKAIKMKHGIVFIDKHGPCFIETNPGKLNSFQKTLANPG